MSPLSALFRHWWKKKDAHEPDDPSLRWFRPYFGSFFRVGIAVSSSATSSSYVDVPLPSSVTLTPADPTVTLPPFPPTAASSLPSPPRVEVISPHTAVVHLLSPSETLSPGMIHTNSNNSSPSRRPTTLLDIRRPVRPISATAAHIPPELFRSIIPDVELNTSSSWKISAGQVGRCSLVCSYWAEHCRRSFYQGQEIVLRTLRNAKGFRRTATQKGSGRLTPIPQLIKCVNVQVRNANKRTVTLERSWLHLVFVESIKAKLLQSSVMFDFEDAFFPRALTQASFMSPHWSLPRSMPASITPYERVELHKAHFHSFTNLAKFLEHFTYAVSFLFERVTWANRHVDMLTRSFAVRRRPLKSVSARGCDDNMLICLQVAKNYPTFPLWKYLSPGNKVIMLGILLTVHATVRGVTDGSGIGRMGASLRSVEITGESLLLIA